MTDQGPSTPRPSRAASRTGSGAAGGPKGWKGDRRLWLLGGVVVVVAVVLAVVLPNSTSPSKDSGNTTFTPTGPRTASTLLTANTTAIDELDQYAAASSSCTTQKNSVVCVEQAEQKFSDQLHAYANVLARGGAFGIRQADLTNALSLSQDTANTFEVLGDAGPTAAAYNRVLNNVNLQVVLNRLESALNTVNDDLRK